jgi:choline transport protein
MSSCSYCAAILPNLLTGRKNITYGPFKLKGLLGPIFNFIACAYIIVWFVIYCFPFYLPTDAATMNYASLIWGGLTLFAAVWWFVGARKRYLGPQTTGGINSEVEHVRRLSIEARRAAA